MLKFYLQINDSTNYEPFIRGRHLWQLSMIYIVKFSNILFLSIYDFLLACPQRNIFSFDHRMGFPVISLNFFVS